MNKLLGILLNVINPLLLAVLVVIFIYKNHITVTLDLHLFTTIVVLLLLSMYGAISFRLKGWH